MPFYSHLYRILVIIYMHALTQESIIKLRAERNLLKQRSLGRALLDLKENDSR